ncbi:MAG: CD1247 N-terminal domain-containing protein [Oscillospiraceae bacterium]
MTLSEKTSYLKGLLDGMDKNDKVINLIADILRDIALELEDQQDQIDEVCEVVDSISDDLDELEEDLYEDEDDDDYYDDDDFDGDDLDDEDDDYGFDEEEMYEATCPTCGNTIVINKSMLEEGSINCPNCSELLEFDLSDEDDDE